jgi:transcription initiation factor TFIIH subunit 1
MLKIFVQPPNTPAGTSEQYVFSFTAGPNARPEADAIKDALSTAIQSAKTPSEGPGAADGMSAAMTMANAVSAGAGRSIWDDDNRLRSDAELQQSLLKSNPNLQRVFMESLNSKPETLSGAQFMAQFWSTRLHLLRAHAIERGQARGSYNVLSTLRPRVEESVTKLNISKEQIQLIFSQHPLIKKVYDENVPKLSEQMFWSRFFQSRLFKRLRGERISENDPTDTVLDKYLKADEHTDKHKDTHVPQFLNLAGNEMNNSQRQGNRPDLDMRPSGVDKVPIIRTLNNLSEKIMANVAPADRDPAAPVGTDEETFNQLQLRDLQGDEEQNRMILNIRDQNRFFSQAKGEDGQGRLFAEQDPEKIITDLRSEIGRNLPEDGTTELRRLVEPDEDDDDETKQTLQVGSKATMHAGSAQILDAVRERRAQAERSSTAGTYGLSAGLYDRLTLTHATTTEFLHQFWQAFLSGNAERAGEVGSLAESLNRALDRIKSVAADAEAERQVEVERVKNHAREVLEATGRKIKANLAGIPGGERTVNQLLGPTNRALELALTKYKTALAEEMKEMPTST